MFANYKMKEDARKLEYHQSQLTKYDKIVNGEKGSIWYGLNKPPLFKILSKYIAEHYDVPDCLIDTIWQLYSKYRAPHVWWAFRLYQDIRLKNPRSFETSLLQNKDEIKLWKHDNKQLLNKQGLFTSKSVIGNELHHLDYNMRQRYYKQVRGAGIEWFLPSYYFSHPAGTMPRQEILATITKCELFHRGEQFVASNCMPDCINPSIFYINGVPHRTTNTGDTIRFHGIQHSRRCVPQLDMITKKQLLEICSNNKLKYKKSMKKDDLYMCIYKQM